MSPEPLGSLLALVHQVERVAGVADFEDAPNELGVLALGFAGGAAEGFAHGGDVGLVGLGAVVPLVGAGDAVAF